MNFIWSQFSALDTYFMNRAQDTVGLNSRVADVLLSLTCKKGSFKNIHERSNSQINEILFCIDTRIQKIYNALPDSAMLIICTGHGDTAIVQR